MVIRCTMIVSLDKNKHTSGTFVLIHIIYIVYHISYKERKGGGTLVTYTHTYWHQSHNYVCKFHWNGQTTGDGYSFMGNLPFLQVYFYKWYYLVIVVSNELKFCLLYFHLDTNVDHGLIMSIGSGNSLEVLLQLEKFIIDKPML